MAAKQRYWFSDGLAELGVGIGFLFTSLVWLLIGVLPTVLLKLLAMPVAGLLISWAFPKAITAVRERWLSTAVGLSVHRTTLRAQLMGAAVILPIVVWLSLDFSALAINFEAADSWRVWCTSIGLFFSLIPLFMGFISGVVRFYLLAVPIIAAGFAAITLTETVAGSALLLWFVTGICFSVSGLIALLRFRAHLKKGNF